MLLILSLSNLKLYFNKRLPLLAAFFFFFIPVCAEQSWFCIYPEKDSSSDEYLNQNKNIFCIVQYENSAEIHVNYQSENYSIYDTLEKIRKEKKHYVYAEKMSDSEKTSETLFTGLNEQEKLELSSVTEIMKKPKNSIQTVLTQKSSDSGYFPSLLIQKNGLPAYIYYDFSTYTLKIASCMEDTCEKTVITTGEGLYSSSDIDDQGNIHIVFYNQLNSSVRYATGTPGNWTLSTLKTDVLDTVNLKLICFSDEVHVFYFNRADYSIRHLVRKEIWTSEIIAAGTGREFSADISNSGEIAVSFYDRTDKDLMISRYDGHWKTDTVEAEGDAGEYSAVCFDKNNNLSVAYLDQGKQSLIYAEYIENQFLKLTADSSGSPSGLYVQMSIDRNDIPHLFYYCGGIYKLKRAVVKKDSVEITEISSGIAKSPLCISAETGKEYLLYSDTSDLMNYTLHLIIPEYTRKIQLKSGWNLVSTGIITESEKPSDLFSGMNLRFVMSFFRNPADEGQEGFRTYLNSPELRSFSTLDNIDPWHGYWIYADTDFEMELTGTAVSSSSTHEVSAGWNLCGYWMEEEGMLPVTLSQKGTVLDCINFPSPLKEAGTAAYLTGFYRNVNDGGQEGFRTFLNNQVIGFSTLKSLLPESGYWIYMNAPGIINYSYRSP